MRFLAAFCGVDRRGSLASTAFEEASSSNPPTFLSHRSVSQADDRRNGADDIIIDFLDHIPWTNPRTPSWSSFVWREPILFKEVEVRLEDSAACSSTEPG